MLKLLDSIQEHAGIVWSLAWNHAGNLLASCGQDKIVNIYHFVDEKGKVVNSLSNSLQNLSLAVVGRIDDAHKRTIRDICWSPTGKSIALASFDGTVSVWDMKSNKEFVRITTIEGHESEVKSVAWSPCGEYLATCGRDKQVMIWVIVDEGENLEFECEAVLGNHGGDVKRVIWHPTEELLMSVGYDNRINIYEKSSSLDDWTVRSHASDHSSTVWAADFDKTGNRIVSCSDDRTLRFHNTMDMKEAQPASLDMEFQRPIYDVSWNKSNGLIATGCGDNLVRVITEINGSPSNECFTLDVKSHQGDVNRVKWNPQPKADGFLASCGDDGCVKLWQWFTPS